MQLRKETGKYLSHKDFLKIRNSSCSCATVITIALAIVVVVVWQIQLAQYRSNLIKLEAHNQHITEFNNLDPALREFIGSYIKDDMFDQESNQFILQADKPALFEFGATLTCIIGVVFVAWIVAILEYTDRKENAYFYADLPFISKTDNFILALMILPVFICSWLHLQFFKYCRKS